MKTCSRCKILQSYDNFTKQKQAKDGYSYYCKNCEKIRKQKLHIINKEKLAVKNKQYRIDNAEKEKLRKQKYYFENKHKCLNSNKRYRLANSLKYLEQQKQYRQTVAGKITKVTAENKRRAIKYNTHNALTEHEKYLIKCIYEFCIFKSTITSIPHHVDHIKPLSKGGSHSPYNLQIITKEDNLKKSNTWRE